MMHMYSPTPSFTYLPYSSPFGFPGSPNHSQSSNSPSSIGETCNTPARQHESYHLLFQSPSSPLPYTFPAYIAETAETLKDINQTKKIWDPAAPRPKTSHAKKQPEGHIRRPRNAFILFRSAFVASSKLQKDVERDHRKISRIVGDIWNSYTPAEKAPYEQMAREEKAQHKIDHPDYRYSPAKPSANGAAKSSKAKKIAKLSYKPKKAVAIGNTRRKEVDGDATAVNMRCRLIAGLMREGLEGQALSDKVEEIERRMAFSDEDASGESDFDDDDSESDYEEERRKRTARKFVTRPKHTKASSLTDVRHHPTTSAETRVHRRTSSTPNIALNAALAATQRVRPQHTRAGSDETTMSSTTRARVQQVRADRSYHSSGLFAPRYISPDDNTTSPLLYFNGPDPVTMGGVKVEGDDSDLPFNINSYTTGSPPQLPLPPLMMSSSPSPLRLSSPLTVPPVTHLQDFPSSSISSSLYDMFDGLDSFLQPEFTLSSSQGMDNVLIDPFNLPEPSRPNNGTMDMTFTFPAFTPAAASNSTGTLGYPELFPLPTTRSITEVDLHGIRMAELDEYLFPPPVSSESDMAQVYENLFALTTAPSPVTVQEQEQHTDFNYWLNYCDATVGNGSGGSTGPSDALMDAYNRGLLEMRE
ncbi:hypothetical protein FRB95_004067 [Tulasnella sp. JGI-2019a]|nr:hypothetical protein FRB95_004067 [Tulasnella sp. JGI-2019a]